MNTNRECKWVRAALSAFTDGAVAPNRIWRIQKHIAVCDACRETAGAYRRISDALHSLPSPVLSHAFDSGLSRKLAPVAAKSRDGQSLPRRLAWALEIALTRLSAARTSAPVAGATIAAATAAALVLALLLFTNPSAHIGRSPARQPAGHSAAAAGDMAFVAACATQQAQYQSLQPIADPTAQVVAERVDASASSEDADPASDAGDD